MSLLVLLACGAGTSTSPVAPEASPETPGQEAPTEGSPTSGGAGEVVPAAEASVTEAVSAVLVQSWDENLALVSCLSPEGLRTGAACSDILLPGTELSHGSMRVKVGAPTQLDCAPLGTKVWATGATSLGVTSDPGESWSWQPAPPLGWTTSTPVDADDALAKAVRDAEAAAGRSRVATSVTVVATADLDGDGDKERVVSAFHGTDDPEKRGFTTLWLADPELRPLPTEGMELNGELVVRGTAPITTGGELLVFTSQWMGGSGVHAVGPVNGEVGSAGEVACGS